MSTYISSRKLSLIDLLLPWRIIRNMASHRLLLAQFIQREVEKRYQGTFLGFLWSLVTPLFMLAVYTIVFGFIYHGSYGHPDETKIQFALGLFCGLLLWDFIASSINMAPRLIVNNANFVKKVIFPLEILPVASVMGSFIHMLVGFIPLLLFLVISQHGISWEALFLIPIFLPVLFYCMGIVWILSAMGVFLRDIEAIMPAILTVVMFMSAVFFPISSIPQAWRWIITLNPAAVLISMARNAVVFGQRPGFMLYGIQFFGSLLVAIIGYTLFMKVKTAFADVL